MKQSVATRRRVDESQRLLRELDASLESGKPLDQAAFDAKYQQIKNLQDAVELERWGNEPSTHQPPPPPSVPGSPPNNGAQARNQWPQSDTLDAFRSYITSGQMQADVMQVSVSELGGFVAPEEFTRRLLARLASEGVVRQAGATVRPTEAGEVVWPRLQEHGTSPAIYTSTFVGGWRAEGATLTAIDAKWGQLRIAIKSAAAFAKLTREFAMDSAVDVLDVLVSDGGRNLALVEDLAFLNGGADPNEPEGILLDGNITTRDISGTTADEISNDTTDLGSATKILDLVADLPAVYRKNASWVMHRAEQANIRKLVDGQGRFLWATGLDSQPSTLLGFPVRLSDHMPEGGTEENRVLLLGDFSHYMIADREQTAIQVLPERFADDGVIGLIIWHRVGGGVSDPQGFVIGTV